MNSYYMHKRPEVAKLLPANISKFKILEIGCGVGAFRSNIDMCSEYWGVEPCDEVAQFAADKLDKVIVGTYKTVCENLPNSYFDLVICNDVIEHMDDEDWFLANIKSKMKSGSMIIGSIPNVRFISVLLKLLIWKDWKYTDEGVLDRTHQRFFTKKSLERAFESNQYEIEDLSGINEIKLNFSNIKIFCKTFGLILFTYFLGRDARFLQFGFRVKVN